MARDLDTEPATGLSTEEAGRRLAAQGPNLLRGVARRGWPAILAAQFRDLVVVLLTVAAGVSVAFGEVPEGIAIVVVLVLNAAIGFVTELRAVRSVEALRKLGQVTAAVRRDGEVRRVPAEDIVVGDVIVVNGGDVVSADMRLVEASRLEADESTLTGESVPAVKSTAAVAADSPLAERTGMLFKGTALTQGSGVGITVGTGMGTELGRISSLVQQGRGETTPLQIRLDRLARRLLWVTGVVAAAVVVAGLLGGQNLSLTLRTAIALAVAAVPEGLPVVATLALARGMLRMARRNALVERLSAVETLGSTTVILTDKTGTLTENRMTVACVALRDRRLDTLAWQRPGTAAPRAEGLLRRALTIGVLCNEASLGGQPERPAGPDGPGRPDGQPPAATGDPMEIALLKVAETAGLSRRDLRERHPRARTEAFDPARKMMATVHRADAALTVAVKGAPEAVVAGSARMATEAGDVPLDEDSRGGWLAAAEELAAAGLRVLALADRAAGGVDEDPYSELTLVGLVGLLDPPREGVREAVGACRDAGVRVVMVTGDHLRTGQAIGERIGLVRPDDTVVAGRDVRPGAELAPGDRERLRRAVVVARASPEQKIDLLNLYQDSGDVVAMIGDGVNDAPALSKADIGVAMGQRGTEVAKEAADMVLRDDRFATIVTAVEQGRVIFDNIRRFVVYLLSCNLSEILVVGVAALAGGPLPLLPLQILFLNLVTDVFPALALGLGGGGPDVLRRPPRHRSEPVVTGAHWRRIVGYAALIGAAALGALVLAVGWLEMPAGQATTVSFLTLAFAQLWHVLNTADPGSGVVVNEVTRNRWVWGAIALCVALLLAGVYLPGLSHALTVVDPGAPGWAVILGLSLMPLAVGRTVHLIRRRAAA